MPGLFRSISPAGCASVWGRGSFWSYLLFGLSLIVGIPRHDMKEQWHYVQYVYVLTHMLTSVVGRGASGNEPCPGMLRGKTVWEKPVCSQSAMTPPHILKLDFLLREWSEETSVPQLPADTHMGIFR